MKRRSFLATLSAVAGLGAAPPAAADGEAWVKSTSHRPSRKVIVGTAMQAFWGPYPGPQNRLEQLAGLVDQMAAQAKKQYGRGLDCGIFWSNDPGITAGEMVRSIGVLGKGVLD